MKILEKYVCKTYVSAFLGCVVLLMVLGVIGDILGFLDDIFRNNIPLMSILKFYLFFTPFAFVNMMPFACLLSTVFVFNNLSKNNEMTAIITSGLSIWNILKPVVTVTFILCLCTFIVNEILVPRTMAKASIIRQEELETSEDKKKIVENIAVYGKDDFLIFARGYDPARKKLENIIIHHQNKERDITEKIVAERAVWDKNGFWTGQNVMVFRRTEDGDFSMDPEVHKTMRLTISEKPSDFLNTQWDPRLMSFKQLKKYVDVLGATSPLAVRRLSVDLNYKFSFPFTAMVTVLVGIPFCITTSRSNVLIGMAKGIAAGMMYLPVTALVLALGKGGSLSPFAAAWLSNVVFISLGVYFINKRS